MSEKYLYIRTGFGECTLWETEDIRAVNWYPGAAIFPL